MKKTKIIIADDHRMVRQGLINLFSLEKKFEVIAETGSGQEVVQLALTHYPDIVIIKIRMPGLNGMEATKKILSKNPNIKIIALSVHTGKLYVMGMLNAGISGYLLKSCSFQELLTAIKVVLSGRIYLCHDVAGIVVESALTSGQNKIESLFSLLSQREREILQLISEGHKNKNIAKKLHISTKTVQVHRTHLKKKLNLNSTAELTKFAISNGLTSLELSPGYPLQDKISEMNPESYLVYETTQTGRIIQQILPASNKHPVGWRCKQIVSAVEKPYKSERIGLGYTKAAE